MTTVRHGIVNQNINNEADPIALPSEFTQELCENRGSRPGLSVFMSLTVSVDVKQHETMLVAVCP